MLSRLDIVPRWIIFSIDLSLSVLALFLATLLNYELDLGTIDYLAFYQSVIALTVINSVVFYFFRTYTGIIRYSSEKDAIRVMYALLAGAFLLACLNTLKVTLGYYSSIRPSTILYYGLFAFPFLFVYRIVVKSIFDYARQFQPKQEKIIERQPVEVDRSLLQAGLKGKVVLVTGAAGCVGRQLVQQLLASEVRLLVMCDHNETMLHHLSLDVVERWRPVYDDLDQRVRIFMGDVRDMDRMSFLFDRYRPEYVFHAAANQQAALMEDHPSEAIKTNVRGTKNIADLAVRYGVHKFIYISTDQAARPANVINASKRLAERYLQALNLRFSEYASRFVVVRFGEVLGTDDTSLRRFQQQIQLGGPVTLSHPELSRSLMTLQEVAALVTLAACTASGGEVFVLNMGPSVKLFDLAKQQIRNAGLVPEAEIAISFTGLRPGEQINDGQAMYEDTLWSGPHPNLKLTEAREHSISSLYSGLYDLLAFAEENSNFKVIASLKQLLPEFKYDSLSYPETERTIVQGSLRERATWKYLESTMKVP